MTLRPTLRPTSVHRRNILIPPGSSDPALQERQEDALFHVREKLNGRYESCNAVVISASTLSRTIMTTQMRCRGWTVSCANHLAEATSLIHQQITKASARGLSVARTRDAVDGDANAPQYNDAGFRIKFADEDAVVRLVLIDCFTHETLFEVVRHIRLLDDAYKLNIVVVYLSEPRPPEGQGYVLAPAHCVTLADAYACGVDLVVPSHFDRTAVEFLTEVFLSSSGRFMKNATNAVTTSNFSQIRSLLMDVTDRHHSHSSNVPRHGIDNVTTEVANLEGYAVTSRKLGLDEDRLEDEVTEARQREDRKRELARQRLLQRQNAASAIDTNPEYISLLSKYEIALRQLGTYKDKITELTASVEEAHLSNEKLTAENKVRETEETRLKEIVAALRQQEEVKKGSTAQHAQLIQREQRIAVLEKEATGFKFKYETSKKLADEALIQVEKLKRETDDLRRHAANINKRFEHRLRSLGVTGSIDLEAEADKYDEGMIALRRDVAKWKRRTAVMRRRLEVATEFELLSHDVDVFGRTGDAILGGIGNLISKDELKQLINGRKGGPPLSGTAQHYLPEGAAVTMTPVGSDINIEELLLSKQRSDRDEGRVSIVSVNSDTALSRSDNASRKTEEDMTPQQPAFMGAFAGFSDAQFNDMSAPLTVDNSAQRAMCDQLVAEARKAVSEGDSVIHEVRQRQKQLEDEKRYHRTDTMGLAQIRTASMFADQQLSRRERLSPPERGVLSPTDAALRMQRDSPAKERSEAAIATLENIGERISQGLSEFVSAAELSEKQAEEQRRQLEASFADFSVLVREDPGPLYETALQKIRTYVAEQAAKRETLFEGNEKTMRPEELERAATDFARWSVILDEVDQRIASHLRVRESGSNAQRQREQLETQLDVLESKALRQIHEMTVTRNATAYVATQKAIFNVRRELRHLPGGKLKAKRSFVNLNGSMSSSSSGQGNKVMDDAPLSMLEILEKGIVAQLETVKGQNMQRRSTKFAEELTNLQSAMKLVHPVGPRAGAEHSPLEGRGRSDRPVSQRGDDDLALRASFTGAGTTTSGRPAMHNVAADMIQRFRSYSVVKATDPGTLAPSTAAIRELVGGIKNMVHTKIESAQDSVHQLATQATDDARHLIADATTFGELDLHSIHKLLERTNAIETPTAVYQLILHFHKELVRLLRQLRKRTALTSINIIDAHQLQRQLREHKSLTKAQLDNIPFIISVDAAQVTRFADYFEKETEALVKEGISRLQRNVDDAAAKASDVDPRTLRVAPDGTSHRRSRSGSLLNSDRSGGTSLQVSPRDGTLDLQSGGARRNSDSGGQQPSDEGVVSLVVPPLTQPAAGGTTPLQPLPLLEPLDTLEPDSGKGALHLIAPGRMDGQGVQPLPPPSKQAMAMSTMCFGASSVGRLLDSDQQRQVIYLPRTPATNYPTRAGLMRRQYGHEGTETPTSKQRMVHDVLQVIQSQQQQSNSGFLPHLPQWAPKMPPPSRQRMANQHPVHQ